eukprot:735688_1
MGYPTLKYFTGDIESPTDYSGGRTESTIVDWLWTQSLPAVTTLASAEEIDTFIKKGPRIVMVGFLTEDSEGAKALNVVAEANRNTVAVGQVTDPEVKIEGREQGKVYLFRDSGDANVLLAAECTVDSLTEFMNAEHFPLIDETG